jgi:hypothetical protein
MPQQSMIFPCKLTVSHLRRAVGIDSARRSECEIGVCWSQIDGTCGRAIPKYGPAISTLADLLCPIGPERLARSEAHGTVGAAVPKYRATCARAIYQSYLLGSIYCTHGRKADSAKVRWIQVHYSASGGVKVRVTIAVGINVVRDHLTGFRGVPIPKYYIRRRSTWIQS